MSTLHQSGARHCADLRGAFSGEDWAEKPAKPSEAEDGALVRASQVGSIRPATAPLCEVALVSDAREHRQSWWLKFVLPYLGYDTRVAAQRSRQAVVEPAPSDHSH
jgi:hypothetical protein